ncbi:MAG: hypothetical protein AAFX04_04930 [Pseudomonadota bacterium]
MIALIFWVLVLLACAYGFLCGGWEARVASIVTVAASLGTYGIYWAGAGGPWLSLQMGVLLVDLAYLGALHWLVLRSRYCWPIWMCAFQLAGVSTHFPGLMPVSLVSDIYEALQGFWSIPVILSMVLGVYYEQNQRNGYDRGQSFGRIDI